MMSEGVRSPLQVAEEEMSTVRLARLNTREWLAKFGLSKLLLHFTKECITVAHCIQLSKDRQLEDWFVEMKLGVMDRMKLKRAIADMAKARALASSKKECKDACVQTDINMEAMERLTRKRKLPLIASFGERISVEDSSAVKPHGAYVTGIAAGGEPDTLADHCYTDSAPVATRSVVRRPIDLHVASPVVAAADSGFWPRRVGAAAVYDSGAVASKKSKSRKSKRRAVLYTPTLDGTKKSASASRQRKEGRRVIPIDLLLVEGVLKVFKAGPKAFPIQRALAKDTSLICSFSLKNGAYVDFTFERTMQRLTHVDYINGEGDLGVSTVLLQVSSGSTGEVTLSLGKRGSRRNRAKDGRVRRKALKPELKNVLKFRVDFKENHGAADGKCSLVYIAFYGRVF